MAGASNSDWIFWLLAGVLGLLGFVVLYFALLRDRSRGRRRCPKCWYDMSGTASLTCSECGKTVKRERTLFKTRRRWRWVVLGTVLVLCAPVSSFVPKVKRHGWISIVPTTALILYLPYALDNEDDITMSELALRLPLSYLPPDRQRSDLWDWQWDLLLDRCIAGDEMRQPTTREWLATYGWLLKLAMDCNRVLEDPIRCGQLAQLFPVNVTLTQLPHAEASRFFSCRMDIHPAWGQSIQYRVTATSELPGAHPLSSEWFWNPCGVGQGLIGFDEGIVGELPEGQSVVRFDIITEFRRFGNQGEYRLWSRTKTEMKVQIASATGR